MSSKTLGAGVCVAVVACLVSLAGVPALAAENDQASIVIRAAGKQGTVTRTRATGRTGDALPAKIEGGDIPRALLQAELANGIGRFLQQVRVKPVVSRGRFVGWRIATLFPNRTDVKVQALAVGDILLRVNGQPVERPEEFKEVWDSLANASELVLDIERAGETTTIRYAIK